MKRTRIWLVLAMASTCLVMAVVGLTAYSQMEPPALPPAFAMEPPVAAPAPGKVPAPPPPRPPALPGGEPVLPVQAIVEEGPDSGTHTAPPGLLPTPGAEVPSVKAEGKVETVPPIEGRPGRQEPAVNLDWVGPSNVRLGQPVTYQILVRNISPGPVYQVSIRHRLPAGVIHRVCEPAAFVEGEELTWLLGTLQPGQVKRVEIQVVPQQRGSLTCQAAVTFTGASILRMQVREPQLALKITAPEKVMAGESATVTLTIHNPGDGTAEGIKIKVVLPEGLEHTRGRNVDVDLGNLGAKESRAIHLVCLAKTGGSQRVVVTAAADGSLSASDTAQLEVVLPKLDLVLHGPKLRYIDRHAVYVFKVSNPGSAPASNVQLSDVVPAGFKFHAASGGGRFDETSRTVSWFVGDLPPGQNREVNLDLVAAVPGDHKQQASVNAGRGLKTDSELITRIEGLSALLMELADVDDPIEVGAETGYEIRVVNTGTKTETNLELVCTLPENMEFKGARCGAGCRFRLDGRDVIFEPLPRLAPRADALYRVNVRCLAPGDFRFRARIRADGLSEPVLREESTRVYRDDAPLR